MSRIRGKDTKPELAFRKALWRTGARYRVHDRTLPGTPDISNKRAKVAVFIDGCFWHGCPVHFKAPKTRASFWAEKIRRNQEQRERVRAAYPTDWHVLEVYECDADDAVRAAVEAMGAR